MENKKKTGVKPPIRSKTPKAPQPPAVVKQNEMAPAPNPIIALSAGDAYLSAAARAASLPGVGKHLSSDRVQSTFAHLFLMTTAELNNLLKTPQSLSILEVQVIRLLIRTLRDLPNKYEKDVDEHGKQRLDKSGKPMMRLAALNKDQLQNEKQALETIKYLHERAFGKSKITIEHSGLPDNTTNNFTMNAVLAAMDNLPRNVVEAIAVPSKKAK